MRLMSECYFGCTSFQTFTDSGNSAVPELAIQIQYYIQRTGANKLTSNNAERSEAWNLKRYFAQFLN